MTGKSPSVKTGKSNTPRKKVNSPSKKSTSPKDVATSAEVSTQSVDAPEISWDGNTTDSNGHVTLNLEFPNGGWEDRCSDTDSSVNLEIVEDSKTTTSYKKSRKRLRSEISPEDNEIIDGMEEEIERQLESKAEKNNLSVLNVKYILRQVITHPHVLAMVRRSAKEGNCSVLGDSDGLEYEPKLTRAKAKELLEKVKDVDWPVTPCKKPVVSEFEALAIQEMAEDSDDEEYQPGEETSDNDYSERDNSELDTPVDQSPAHVEADDSAPCTPDSTADRSITLWSEDGIFKVPMAPSDQVKDSTSMQEEGVIAKRTRSKLSLSDTPLEEIEKAFIAPDVPPGYYETQVNDTNCDNEDWHEFLKEFMEPIPTGSHGTGVNDDDEADPEYNVLAEEEVVDKEELRMDRAVKVSRKEAKALLAELFDFPENMSSEDDDNVTDGSTLSKSMHPSIVYQADSTSTTAHATPGLSTPSRLQQTGENQEEDKAKVIEKGIPGDVAVITREGETHETEVQQTIQEEQQCVDCAYQFSLSQRLLLDQQMRQHVQLLTQNFLLSYKHPVYVEYADEFMKMLDNIRERAEKSHPQSLFRVANLPASFQIIEEWKQIMNSQKGESIKENRGVSKRSKYQGRLPPELIDLMSNSVAFVTPQLLPEAPFRCKVKKVCYMPSELMLIALGLEEFLEFIKTHSTGPKRFHFQQALQYLSEYLVTTKTAEQLHVCFRKEKWKAESPIKYYHDNHRAPATVHYVFPFSPDGMLTPRQQPSFLLPEAWRNFLYPASSKN